MSGRFLALLSLGAGLALALAGGAIATSTSPSLPPGWSHAEINVTINGAPHTLIYDRGRIIAVSAASITLRERDGSVWVIGVSSSTQITIDGQPATISQVRRLENATTLRVDGGDATTVTVTIPPALAAAIAAAEARQQARQAQAALAQQARAARRAARQGGQEAA